MQLFEHMGDTRHKNPTPQDEPTEPVTSEFRDQVKRRLNENRVANEKAGRNKRDPDRMLDDYASLARAVGTDTTQITNILGPARPTSKKKKLVEVSAFVRPICRALGIPPSTMMLVPDDMVAAVQALRDLPEDQRQIIRGALDGMIASKTRPRP